MSRNSSILSRHCCSFIVCLKMSEFFATDRTANQFKFNQYHSNECLLGDNIKGWITAPYLPKSASNNNCEFLTPGI